MSKQLIDRSPDLKRLRDEGYDLEIRSNYLIVRDVPYVNEKRQVLRGVLVSELTTAGESTAAPKDHVVDFAGETPCDSTGAPLSKVVIGNTMTPLIIGYLVVTHKFSSKPIPGGIYKDYYEKMTAYVAILESYARAIDPSVTAKTFPVIPVDDDESVFKYLDTASSRAQISLVTKKLELAKVGLVGLGGTGSYILDLVAKAPVKEIHLFDGDDFQNHNAFRTPGAASIEELNAKPKKVAYLMELYSKLRRGLFAHPYYMDSSNVGELQGMDFVFLSIDPGEAKKLIVEALERFGIPFIDVGMGIDMVDDSLHGILRITTNTPNRRDHFRSRVGLADAGVHDEYERNIQVADLNALNAALAVVKWKKLCGFYLDFQNEYHTTYAVDCNALTSDERT
jgi:hypothetical protein